MVQVFLFFSILVNFFTVWYIYRLLKLLLDTSQDIGEVKDTFDDFRGHLEGLYETNAYYGDASLKALIDHSKLVLERLEQFEEVYELTEPKGEILDEESEA